MQLHLFFVVAPHDQEKGVLLRTVHCDVSCPSYQKHALKNYPQGDGAHNC